LYGVCETFYREGLNPEELFEVISNCLLSALDRDSLSGWGAKVYILTPTDLIVRDLKTRQD
jgi:20S proteasome subunit beta 3